MPRVLLERESKELQVRMAPRVSKAPPVRVYKGPPVSLELRVQLAFRVPPAQTASPGLKALRGRVPRVLPASPAHRVSRVLPVLGYKVPPAKLVLKGRLEPKVQQDL